MNSLPNSTLTTINTLSISILTAVFVPPLFSIYSINYYIIHFIFLIIFIFFIFKKSLGLAITPSRITFLYPDKDRGILPQPMHSSPGYPLAQVSASGDAWVRSYVKSKFPNEDVTIMFLMHFIIFFILPNL